MFGVICVINERVSDIDRMVGAAFQIRDHICEDDPGDRVTDLVHKALDMKQRSRSVTISVKMTPATG